MIFKKLANNCRRQRKILLYEGWDGTQWLSDGRAMYPLYGFPRVDENMLVRVLDISEKMAEKVTIEHYDALPRHMDFNDVPEWELPTTEEGLSIGYDGKIFCPVYTSHGLQLYDPACLEPLKDAENPVSLYERTDGEGKLYFAAKDGMMLDAVILPVQLEKNERALLATALETMGGMLMRDLPAEGQEDGDAP